MIIKHIIISSFQIYKLVSTHFTHVYKSIMVWYNVYAISFNVPNTQAPDTTHNGILIMPDDAKAVDVALNPNYSTLSPPANDSTPQQPKYIVKKPLVYFIEYHGLVFDPKTARFEKDKFTKRQLHDAKYYLSIEQQEERTGNGDKSVITASESDQDTDDPELETAQQYIRAPKAMAIPDWLRPAMNVEPSEKQKSPLDVRIETTGTPENMYLHPGKATQLPENGYPITGYVLLGKSVDPNGILKAAEQIAKFLISSTLSDQQGQSNGGEETFSNDQTEGPGSGVGAQASKSFINSVIETVYQQRIFTPTDEGDDTDKVQDQEKGVDGINGSANTNSIAQRTEMISTVDSTKRLATDASQSKSYPHGSLQKDSKHLSFPVAKNEGNIELKLPIPKKERNKLAAESLQLDTRHQPKGLQMQNEKIDSLDTSLESRKPRRHNFFKPQKMHIVKHTKFETDVDPRSQQHTSGRTHRFSLGHLNNTFGAYEKNEKTATKPEESAHPESLDRSKSKSRRRRLLSAVTGRS